MTRVMPPKPCTVADFGCKVSMMAVNGTTKVSPATVTTIPSSTASVSGKLMVKVEPCCGFDRIEMRPPSAWMDSRTTSMPTPRPEMSETADAVEKPGRKIRLSISSSDRGASAAMRPFAAASDLTRARSIPAPSSAILITIRPDRCNAERWTKPSSGFPSAIRRSGLPVHDRWHSGSCGSADRPSARSPCYRLPSLLTARGADGLAGHPRALPHQPGHRLEYRLHRPRADRHYAVLNFPRQLFQLVEAVRNARRTGEPSLQHLLRQHGLIDHQ